jgi:photosystem II stability/assembly factor-like uncharacterized protein
MRRKTFNALALILVMATGGMTAAHAEAPVLVHVHGLSFSPDGKKLIVPSHVGLAVYEGGKWTKAPGPAHDYMGYSGTRDALYSSGHPAPGSGLANPFGLIKSTDGGSTWQKLGLEGESDFHTMTAGYGTNTVYVLNPQPNSRMDSAGLYFTRTDGKSWQRAQARGLTGQVNALAAHPADPAVVAAATDVGLYLSRDAGTSFTLLGGKQRVLSATFDQNGNQLWYSGFDKKPVLSTISLFGDAKSRPVALPPLPQDAVSHIAQNAVQPGEVAIATFKRNVFVSKDGGRNWTQIAKEGAPST